MTGEPVAATADPLARALAGLPEANGDLPLEIVREPIGSGWYRTEGVIARWSSGAELRCFLKDFGSFARVKSRMRDRRERERFFYKSVFPNGELGIPRYLADVWNEDDQSYQLVLEFVDGVPLSWCELDVWFQAASWLGRFHRRLQPFLPDLIASGKFGRHDERYFSRAFERAVAAAKEYPADVARTVEGCRDAYMSHAERLVSHPRALVHNAFRPEQILIDLDEDPVRVCPIDWEIAAIGSSLYDLATLADGFDDEHLEVFSANYRSGAGLSPDEEALNELRAAVAACRMNRTIKWIAGASDRGLPVEKVAELTGLLEPNGATT